MKKYFVSIVLTASLVFAGCDAFKESYDNQAGAVDRDSSVGGDEDKPGGGAGGGELNDFDSDKTLCTAVEGVKISAVDEKDSDAVEKTELAVGGTLAESASATAEKLSSYTTKIVISNGTDALSLTLKQTGEKEFSLCSIGYNDKADLSGKISVAKFNAGSDAASTVNSGTFDLSFESGEAATIISRLAGSKKKAVAIDITGSYYVEGLKE